MRRIDVSMGGHISGSLINTILDVAESSGMSRSALLSSSGLAVSHNKNAYGSNSHDKKMSTAQVITLLDKITSETNNHTIGLDVGRNVRPGSLNALGYALMSSKNLYEALQLQKAFGGIISDCAELKINLDHPSLVYISFTIVDLSAEAARPLHDMFLSMFWNYANWITRTEGRLEQVCFSHEAPAYSSEYTKVFGIEPCFKQSECKLVFDKRYLDEPLYQADEVLNSLMREQTETLFKKSKSYTSYYAAVAYQVRQLMPLQKATLTRVSQNLNMSERTLSRKLKEEGYTFKSVLLSVRESLALEYLRDNDLSVNAIASKLGYLDYSSFSNAFRSWTGHSPSEYRDKPTHSTNAS